MSYSCRTNFLRNLIKGGHYPPSMVRNFIFCERTTRYSLESSRSPPRDGQDRAARFVYRRKISTEEALPEKPKMFDPGDRRCRSRPQASTISPSLSCSFCPKVGAHVGLCSRKIMDANRRALSSTQLLKKRQVLFKKIEDCRTVVVPSVVQLIFKKNHRGDPYIPCL